MVVVEVEARVHEQEMEPRIKTLIKEEVARSMRELRAGRLAEESPKETTTTADNVAPEYFERSAFEGSADATDLTNFYSFAMTNLEAVLRGRQSLRIKQALRILGLLFSMCALVLTQLVLAYGFYDAAVVLKVQTYTLPAFRDPLPFSFWYMDSIVPGTQIAALNCIASVCAIVLLGIYLKNDNEGTLITVCPLELLCLPGAGGALPHAWSGGPLAACWRVPIILVAQACWCIRALLVPVLAGFGTVGAMLNSQNGQDSTGSMARSHDRWVAHSLLVPLSPCLFAHPERSGPPLVPRPPPLPLFCRVHHPSPSAVVLNSVAIGFVLELDEFIYDNLLGKSVRLRYESRQLPPTSTLAIPGGSTIATVYANVIYLLDVGFLLHAFFEEVYEPAHLHVPTMVEVDLARRYDRLRVFIMTRCAALAVAQAHLAMASSGARKAARSKLAWLVLLMVVLSLLIAAAMYTLVLAGVFDGYLGNSFPNVMLSPMTMACAIQQDPFVQYSAGDAYDSDVGEQFRDYICPMLDEKIKPSDGTPTIFEQVVAAADAADANDYDNPMELAWGRYPPLGYYFSHVAAIRSAS